METQQEPVRVPTAVAEPAPDEVWRDWMRSFGRHIRRVREFLSLSQDQLATSAGVSQGAISRFEGGRGIQTPFLVVLRVNMALARQLRTLQPASLTPDVRRFLQHMEFLSVPIEPGGPPAPGGVTLPDLRLAPDPGVEAVMRRYRSLRRDRRAAFIAAVDALASALE